MAGYGWRTYVVPAWQLRELIESHKEALSREWYPIAKDTTQGYSRQMGETEDGWLALLSIRMQVHHNIPLDSHRRWLYRVMNEESIICEAERVDHVCMALGILLENSNLQVFPGNRGHARDIVEIEAEMNGTVLTPKQIEERITDLIQARNATIYKYGISEKSRKMSAKATQRRLAKKNITIPGGQPKITERMGEQVTA